MKTHKTALFDKLKTSAIRHAPLGVVIGGLTLPTLALAGDSAAPDVLTMLGRLHPLAVHFPIGLILLAGFLELFRRKAGTRMPVQAIPLILGISAVGAIIAMAAGWQLAESGGGFDKDLIFWHRWLGVAAAACSMLAAITAYGLSRSGDGAITWVYRFFLYAAIGSVMLGGHYGGVLTHGDPFRDMPATASGHHHGAPGELEAGQDDPPNENKAPDFFKFIKPVFVQHCHKCHGAKKQKGFFRLDKRKYLFRGNPTAWAIHPGNAEDSLFMKLIVAPADAKDKMPPKGERLSAKDIDAIRQWINSGADWPDE